jgi:hypothetical protein
MADFEMKREVYNFIHRQNALARLKKEGLYFTAPVIVPPEFLDANGNLIIREDVADMPTEELSRYLSIFTALSAHYSYITACTDIDYTTAKRVCSYIEAKKLLDLKDEYGGKVTLQKAARDLDPLVIQAQDWADEQEAVYKLANALLVGCEKIIFLLSREITRRGHNLTYTVKGQSLLDTSDRGGDVDGEH